jgi:hemerythrin
MAFFEWSDKFSVHIKEIDEQHKKLVAMLDELYVAMEAGQGSDVLGKILMEMVDYAGTHFSYEENLMLQHDYPEYIKHRAEHDVFVAKVSDLLQRYEKNPNVLSVETGIFLKKWLTNHIMGSDQLYAPWLNEKGIY